MLKRKRKGFTLVELLVVIAILAILATVSVVGYTQFTKKAKLSNDQTTVTMLNDNLRALAVEKQPETASEALSQLYTVGFTKDKFTTYSTGYHYVYDRAENKFYLADEKGNITFPEAKANTTNMWALYKNQNTDKVDGVLNYVALEPITDQYKFDSVFGGGMEYVIDLNNYYISVEPQTATVKLINGSVTSDVADSFNCDNVTVLEKATTQDSSYGSEGLVENMVFDFLSGVNDKAEQKALIAVLGNSAQNGTLTIRNCTFINSYDAQFQWTTTGEEKITKVIIENCTFSGSTKWALAIGSLSGTDPVVYEVRDNLFYNCERGINIQKLTTTGNVIENNKFILYNDEKAKVFQLANYTSDCFGNIDDGEVFVTVRNNSIESAVAILNIHESLVYAAETINGKKTGKYLDVDIVTGEKYKKILKFEGTNTCASASENVTPDIPDREYEPNRKAWMDTMVDYYNSIFQ